jgi:hypothetical protein
MGRMLIYILPIFLFSCGKKNSNTVPENILSKEKMVQVLTDIHIAEAEMSLGAFPDSSSKEKISFQKIFEKEQITKEQYETSLSFYIDHPEMLNEIYQEVLNELSKKQSATLNH